MTESLISFHDELEKMAAKEVVRGAVLGGGIGAAIGGLAGYSSGGEKRKPTEKDRREAAFYSAISGGITGAFLGGAMGGIAAGPRGPRRRAYGGRSPSDWDREFSDIFRRARERHRQQYGGGRYGGGQRQYRGRQGAGTDRSAQFRQKAGPKPEWMGDVKSKDEAKKKWRKVVMKVHPDRARTTKQRADFEEKAKKINAEWDAWRAGRTYKSLKTKISTVLALRGMDADSFGFLTGRNEYVV